MKRIIFISIKVFISLFLLWFLAHTSKLNFNLLPSMLTSPGLLLITLFLYLIVISISSWRWHLLNKAQSIQLTYPHTLLPTYLGVAFNNLLPGGVGGDFFRFYFLNKKLPTKKSAVMLSILLDRLTGLTGIFITVCLIAVFYLHFKTSTLPFYFMAFCIVFCLSIILFYFILSFLKKKISITHWFRTRFSHKKWAGFILSFLDALYIYRSSKKIIMQCLVLSVVIQIFIAITCMLIAKMMHFPPLSFSDYVLAIALTQIINLIPIAPGGFGVGEIAFANILSLLNPTIHATYATIFLAYRIIGIIIYLPGLLVFIFDKHLLKINMTLDEKMSIQ